MEQRQPLLEERLKRRNEIISFIIGAVILACVVNVLADALYERLRRGEPSNIFLGAIFVITIVLIWLAISLVYARDKMRRLEIELVLPFWITRREARIEGIPGYRVLTGCAQQAWMQILNAKQEDLKEFCTAWRSSRSDKRSDKPFPPIVWRRIYDLLQYIVVQYLARYGEETLEPTAWFRERSYLKDRMEGEEKQFTNLPKGLRRNYFLREQKPFMRSKFLLPKGLEIKQTNLVKHPLVGELFDISLESRYGKVIIRILPYWSYVSERDRAGKIFYKYIPKDRHSHLKLIKTRIRLTAEFEWLRFWRIFGRGDENFYLWAMELLSFLEEELDWRYFSRDDLSRMVAALSAQVEGMLEGK